MPYEYVKKLLQKLLENYSLPELSKKCGVRQTILQDLIEDKNVSRHNVLMRLVYNIEGSEAGDKFVMEFKDFSQSFKTASILLETRQSQSPILGKPTPPEKDLLDPKKLEIFMLTSCDNGIRRSELLKILPHRRCLIEKLEEDGHIKEIGDRLYSDYHLSRNATINLIRSKIDVKQSITLRESDISSVFSADERLDPEGVAKYYELVDSVIKQYKEIKKQHVNPEGILVSLNCFMSAFQIDTKQRDQIVTALKSAEYKKESIL